MFLQHCHRFPKFCDTRFIKHLTHYLVGDIFLSVSYRHCCAFARTLFKVRLCSIEFCLKSVSVNMYIRAMCVRVSVHFLWCLTVYAEVSFFHDCFVNEL
jgi:hypothetical protein